MPQITTNFIPPIFVSSVPCQPGWTIYGSVNREKPAFSLHRPSRCTSRTLINTQEWKQLSIQIESKKGAAMHTLMRLHEPALGHQSTTHLRSILLGARPATDMSISQLASPTEPTSFHQWSKLYEACGVPRVLLWYQWLWLALSHFCCRGVQRLAVHNQ